MSKQLESKPVARRLALDWPFWLFLLSAAWGWWIAYDRAAAGIKFWLILGGLVLYVVCKYAPERIRVNGRDGVSPLRVVLSVLPTVVAICFLLTNDWARWIGKLPWLDLAMRWFSSWQFKGGPALNPNVAGGVIAAFLPLQVAALRVEGRKTYLDGRVSDGRIGSGLADDGNARRLVIVGGGSRRLGAVETEWAAGSGARDSAAR